ncbi:MAG TPA: SH3 domain-containing protein [Rectinema sp.]|nr:SH3 domain-containing protein [Rectinema sp.]HNV36640.1 SH3 domain-containing protein [Rectinema sp.]HPY05541.1 SH3 domain-containing protein [Rectinema sp.]HQL85245.1 SH3 domain-containing protein [Rectinema sp.]
MVYYSIFVPTKNTSKNLLLIVHSRCMNFEERRDQGVSKGVFSIVGLVLILFCILLASCARLEGWGLVIWSVKGTTAKAGSIVPVYLKSNISKTYMIGLPDDSKTKIEVPFATIEFFASKKAAEKRAREFAPYALYYLSAGRDGLPVRDKPSVTGRRVYRLMIGESVKVLNRVEGEAVFTGGKALPGEWYFVQAADGTRGYVFSNTMILYEEKEGVSVPVLTTAPTPSVSLLDMIYAKPWRPAYFQLMLDEDTVDPDLFLLQYGLFADAKNSQVRIELPGYSKAFSFGSVSQIGDWLVFEGSNLRIKFENESTIVADWSGLEPMLPEEGWTPGGQAARFVRFDASIPVIISGENSRRDSELKVFFQRVSQLQTNGSSSSATFLSDHAGILTIDLKGNFEWSHIDQLPAGFVPEVSLGSGSGSDGNVLRGRIRFGLHLETQLSSYWMGGFSLFMGEEPQRYDFLYRFENEQLIMAKAIQVSLRGTTESIDSRFSPVSFYLISK